MPIKIMKFCILGSLGGYALEYLILAMKLGVINAEVSLIVTDRHSRTAARAWPSG